MKRHVCVTGEKQSSCDVQATGREMEQVEGVLELKSEAKTAMDEVSWEGESESVDTIFTRNYWRSHLGERRGV